MKRKIFRALCFLCSAILCIGVLMPSAPSAQAIMSNRLGDVDNDGAITASDARLCLRCSVYLDDLSYLDMLACDIDGDMYVSAEDARSILRLSVNLPVENMQQYTAPRTEADVPAGEKIIYLTFDDGPSSYTQSILDILDEYGVYATFFVIYNGDYYNEYENIVTHGHTIALHSYTHDYATIYSSTSAYFNDLQHISDVVYNATGIRSNLMRFPGGSSNTVSRSYSTGIMSTLVNSVQDAGYTYFDWNATNDDATGEDLSADELYSAAISAAGEDAIVMLMHDTDYKAETVKALPWIISYYQSLGYYFLPLNANSPTAHHGVNN